MKHAGYFKIVLVCVYVCVYVLSSCQPDTVCREKLEVGLIAELREVYMDQNKSIQVGTLWDSITAQGLGNADTLYNNAKSVQKLLLPLHTTADSTQYTLTYHGATDTITIGHTHQQEFVSVECGCIYNHDLLYVHATNHWIDSIYIGTTNISRMGETNIYFWGTR